MCKSLTKRSRSDTLSFYRSHLSEINLTASTTMDFSAWFEAYLGGHWHTFDARHNCRRIGRVLIGRGRDAGDVPITMVFGRHLLENFSVITEKIDPGNTAHAVDGG